MAHRGAVKQHVEEARAARTVEAKLDALALAINELARFVGNAEDNLSSKIDDVERKLRR
jgi:hypothetical protein